MRFDQNYEKYSHKILPIILTIAALPIAIYGLSELIHSYWLRVWRENSFFEDFGLFYEMGRRAWHNPSQLYDGSDGRGAWIVKLNERIFHVYSPVAGLLFGILTLVPYRISYIMMTIGSMIAYLVSVYIYQKRIDTEEYNYPRRILDLIPVLAFAPFFTDVYAGNVNSYLLLTCALYGYYSEKNKYIRSSFFLALGVCLKLYPIMLLSVPIFRKSYKELMWFFIWLSIMISLSFLQIPLELYLQFYLEILPAYSHQTTLHIYNQSVHAILMRFILGPESYLSWDNVLTPIWIRIIILFIALFFIGLAGIIAVNSTRYSRYIAESVLLIAVPLLTPVGWGYSFTLSLPGYLFVLLAVVGSRVCGSFLFKGIGSIALLAFMIPSYTFPCLVKGSSILSLSFMSRYFIASVMLCAAMIWFLRCKSFNNCRYYIM